MRKMSNQEERLAKAIEAANEKEYISDLRGAINKPDGFKGKSFTVVIQAMYKYVPSTFATLSMVGEFFGTGEVDIVPDSHESYGGCETCDYGSEYTFVLRVYPVA